MVSMQEGLHTPVIRAILGPTNTGKTHLAIERMLGHRTGMIGFPLRLLARENYDRVVALRGVTAVALITGEERIVPENPRWYVCTVESMPKDLEVDFLAVDEIQLCGDPERGHVFTDRLLHARGREETMFMGSDTMAPIIRSLVRDVSYENRPRFSRLKYVGAKKISQLPRRCATIVFSSNDLYALAERLRRQRGGAAVVLGGLSPRARNAQVAMYQAGEVEHLVATDAIGMGLNMDIEHVAFASLHKFDGVRQRLLGPAEIGQIAGRAGRHIADGTFGVTNNCGELNPAVVEAVEEHRFENLRAIFWRNHELDFSSPSALLNSLGTPVPNRRFIGCYNADDHKALGALSNDEVVVGQARNPASVRLLWEVCQIPDFRKVMVEKHTELLRSIYLHLRGAKGQLPSDWVDTQISRLENLSGKIDALTARIAHVRTWTYVSHRADWFVDARHWQERTRNLEDRLSDVLHERLTQLFVDRHATLLAHRLRDKGKLLAGVNKLGEVFVEGEVVGQFSGLNFALDPLVKDTTKVLRIAARRAAINELSSRVRLLIQDSDEAFLLDKDFGIYWRKVKIGLIRKGSGILVPRIALLNNDLIDAPHREQILARLQAWLEQHVRRNFSPLFNKNFQCGSSAISGLCFQLCEWLGSMPRSVAQTQIAALEAGDRKILSKLGVRMGVYTVYITRLLRPEIIRLRALLWSVYLGGTDIDISTFGEPVLEMEGVGSDSQSYIGYRCFGAFGLRVDNVEKVASAARKKARQGSFLLTPDLVSAAGCKRDRLVAVLSGLGYRVDREELGPVFSMDRRRFASRRDSIPRNRIVATTGKGGSHFSKLRELVVTK